MAYPSARVRPPIFDSALQAALERRAVEFLGLGLLALSGLTAMMFTVDIGFVLGSYYSPYLGLERQFDRLPRVRHPAPRRHRLEHQP